MTSFLASRFRYAFPFTCQMPRRSCASFVAFTAGDFAAADFAPDAACAQADAVNTHSANTALTFVLRSPEEDAQRRVLLRCTHTRATPRPLAADAGEHAL